MPDSNSATPLPDANPGASQPNLSVVPEAEAPSHTRGEFNKVVETELTKAGDLCAVAQRAEYAPALATRGINAAFVTALVNEITACGQRSQHAVNCDTARKDATQAEAAAQQTLVDSLRTIQGTARVQHLPEHPVMLNDYLVGEELDANRPLLERSSQAIINKANAERPGGLNTDFILRAQGERTAFVAANTAQSTEESKAQQDRATRDALLKSIIARRKKIQYAADTLWPHRKSESVQARKDFKLPARRPYSY